MAKIKHIMDLIKKKCSPTPQNMLKIASGVIDILFYNKSNKIQVIADVY